MNLNVGNRDGQFFWFHGIIEDIQDPLKLGRARVRCIGYHNEDKDILPTEYLPWAHVVMPVTSASYKGIGQSPLGLKVGSWVVGFFRDGASGQDPLILGSIPSRTDGVDDIPVEAKTNYPNHHVIHTNGGQVIEWDDDSQYIRLSSNGCKVELGVGGILIDAGSTKNVVIKGAQIHLNPE